MRKVHIEGRLELGVAGTQKNGLLDLFLEKNVDPIVERSGLTRKLFGADATTTRGAVKREFVQLLSLLPRPFR
jgi:hypothetical protein